MTSLPLIVNVMAADVMELAIQIKPNDAAIYFLNVFY